MDATLLIADNDAFRRNELRRYFFDNGFLVMRVANGLECISALASLAPDVLVLALEIPFGGADGVIARLHEDLQLRKRPLVFVMGNASAETISMRTSVPQRNCFSDGFRRKDLLEGIQIELAARAADGNEVAACEPLSQRQTLIKEEI
jgi:CheY-like chemotaxis protein